MEAAVACNEHRGKERESLGMTNHANIDWAHSPQTRHWKRTVIKLCRVQHTSRDTKDTHAWTQT